MSFNDLIKSDYSKKEEQIIFKLDGKDIKFTAKEISYLQRLNLAIIQREGGDVYTQLIINSIKDEDGKYMTKEQAEALPEEYIIKFFEAATRVNKLDAEKN